MRRAVALLVLASLLLPVRSWAQEAPADSSAHEAYKLLVVPFEHRMFFTDVMQEMTQGTGMSADVVVSTLRNGIQQSLRSGGTDQLKVGTFMGSDSIPEDHLTGIYEQMALRYIPVNSASKGDAQRKSSIERGQVRAVRDTTARYMSCEMKDPAILGSIRASKGYERFLFINQIEVRMDLSDPEQSMRMDKRTVVVHFTVMDAQGNPLKGGLASHLFDGGAQDVQRVMSEAFGPIAKQMLAAAAPKKKEEKKAAK